VAIPGSFPQLPAGQVFADLSVAKELPMASPLVLPRIPWSSPSRVGPSGWQAEESQCKSCRTLRCDVLESRKLGTIGTIAVQRTT
jgi:hypothetical protein